MTRTSQPRKLIAHIRRHVSEIRGDTHLDPVGAEGQPHRIGGVVVWNGERSDLNIANLQLASRGKNLRPRELRQLTRLVTQSPRPGLMGSAGHEHRHLKFSGQHRQPVNVIRVFVSNQDGGKRARIVALGAHALHGLAAGNASVHQNLRPRTGDDGAVPRLPLASTETETPMSEEYSRRLWKRE